MAAEVAAWLVEIGAVELRPDPEDWFTWSSGRRAPIYCDNRLLMSFPEVRARVADALTETIRRSFPGCEVVAGTATAGIPHAAWVAERLDLPMVYVRSNAKGHGRGRQIEGRPLAGESVVLVEDLISYGGSAATAVEALRAEGGKVIGVQAIFSYGFAEARERFAQLGVPAQALSSYTVLLDTLDLEPDRLRVLREWQAP